MSDMPSGPEPIKTHATTKRPVAANVQTPTAAMYNEALEREGEDGVDFGAMPISHVHFGPNGEAERCIDELDLTREEYAYYGGRDDEIPAFVRDPDYYTRLHVDGDSALRAFLRRHPRGRVAYHEKGSPLYKEGASKQVVKFGEDTILCWYPREDMERARAEEARQTALADLRDPEIFFEKHGRKPTREERVALGDALEREFDVGDRDRLESLVRRRRNEYEGRRALSRSKTAGLSLEDAYELGIRESARDIADEKGIQVQSVSRRQAMERWQENLTEQQRRVALGTRGDRRDWGADVDFFERQSRRGQSFAIPDAQIGPDTIEAVRRNREQGRQRYEENRQARDNRPPQAGRR